MCGFGDFLRGRGSRFRPCLRACCLVLLSCDINNVSIEI